MFAEVSRHLMTAGGKRFRPCSCCWPPGSATAADQRIVPRRSRSSSPTWRRLFHDDVMDEAVMRRGSPVGERAVRQLGGDPDRRLLFARASRILADLGPEAVRIQAETFERLVPGSSPRRSACARASDPLEHYIRSLPTRPAR